MLPLMPPFIPPGKLLNTLEVRLEGKLASANEKDASPLSRKQNFAACETREVVSQLFDRINVPLDLKPTLSVRN